MPEQNAITPVKNLEKQHKSWSQAVSLVFIWTLNIFSIVKNNLDFNNQHSFNYHHILIFCKTLQSPFEGNYSRVKKLFTLMPYQLTEQFTETLQTYCELVNISTPMLEDFSRIFDCIYDYVFFLCWINCFVVSFVKQNKTKKLNPNDFFNRS